VGDERAPLGLYQTFTLVKAIFTAVFTVGRDTEAETDELPQLPEDSYPPEQ
jgi:hypothetical protein